MRRGIKKTVEGGKIKEVFAIKEGKDGKEIVSHRLFDDDEVKKRGPKRNAR